MKKLLTYIGAFILIAGPISCTISHRAEVNECAAKGVAYFKEIGAYPKLTTTGEDAEKVAVERCERTKLAFGE